MAMVVVEEEESFDALMCFSALAGSRRVRGIEKGVTSMSARVVYVIQSARRSRTALAIIIASLIARFCNKTVSVRPSRASSRTIYSRLFINYVRARARVPHVRASCIASSEQKDRNEE